ncbi:unnamed protein product [Gongylonema pulchrum]|uniref:DUF1279 domain-containing protein n=1 Tax=Gongylonema pulchrum TaxID=637853 RepID=A0A183DRF0_9BILA|nr:unnamed protein product [Gongylonema pulchrum]
MLASVDIHRFPSTSSHASSLLASNSYVFCGTGRVLLHTAAQRFDVPPPPPPLEEHDEKLKKAEDAVKKEHKEAKPTGLFAKLKYYLKRYWYIAIPIHIVNCAVWFIVFYIVCRSGLDVVALLEKCHLPDSLINKVKSTPPNAGYAVVAFLLYKIATPLRYATTLLLIQLSFPVLRRFGILTAKEVKYRMRLKYTNKMRKMKRRYQQNLHRARGGELHEDSKKRPNAGGSLKKP